MFKTLKLSLLPIFLINIAAYATDCSNGINASDISEINIATPRDWRDVDTHNQHSYVKFKNGATFRFNSPGYASKDNLGFSWQCFGFSSTHITQLPANCSLYFHKANNRVVCECTSSGCADMR